MLPACIVVLLGHQCQPIGAGPRDIHCGSTRERDVALCSNQFADMIGFLLLGGAPSLKTLLLLVLRIRSDVHGVAADMWHVRTRGDNHASKQHRL